MLSMRRHVAQPGSAPSWGVGGRRFKSSRADQKYIENQPFMAGFLLRLVRRFAQINQRNQANHRSGIKCIFRTKRFPNNTG